MATPHLGVQRHTFLEDISLPSPPVFVKSLVSHLLLQSGLELFSLDAPVFNQTLIYRMSTEKPFLESLRAFKSRRLYANLLLDFMVPLGTAAFLSAEEVSSLRRQYANQEGIVTVIHSNDSVFLDRRSEEAEDSSIREDRLYSQMIDGLNSLDWDKVLVRFPGRFLPMAHDKICAMTKFPAFIDQWLGYPEGRFVMDNVVDCLTGNSSHTEETEGNLF